MTEPPCRRDVLLVCSSGGHLLQLLALSRCWENHDRIWVTEGTSDAESLLAAEDVITAHGPAERSPLNLFRNLILAFRVLVRVRPGVIVTTGAAVAVPFAWVGRLFGARIVFVESLTRTTTPSLTCRLVRPVAHRIYVQWPELADTLREGRYRGSVFSAR